ncbi:unnamed protein product [Choristocarpus tenellus]
MDQVQHSPVDIMSMPNIHTLPDYEIEVGQEDVSRDEKVDFEGEICGELDPPPGPFRNCAMPGVGSPSTDEDRDKFINGFLDMLERLKVKRLNCKNDSESGVTRGESLVEVKEPATTASPGSPLKHDVYDSHFVEIIPWFPKDCGSKDPRYEANPLTKIKGPHPRKPSQKIDHQERMYEYADCKSRITRDWKLRGSDKETDMFERDAYVNGPLKRNGRCIHPEKVERSNLVSMSPRERKCQKIFLRELEILLRARRKPLPLPDFEEVFLEVFGHMSLVNRDKVILWIDSGHLPGIKYYFKSVDKWLTLDETSLSMSFRNIGRGENDRLERSASSEELEPLKSYPKNCTRSQINHHKKLMVHKWAVEEEEHNRVVRRKVGMEWDEDEDWKSRPSRHDPSPRRGCREMAGVRRPSRVVPGGRHSSRLEPSARRYSSMSLSRGGKSRQDLNLEMPEGWRRAKPFKEREEEGTFHRSGCRVKVEGFSLNGRSVPTERPDHKKDRWRGMRRERCRSRSTSRRRRRRDLKDGRGRRGSSMEKSSSQSGLGKSRWSIRSRRWSKDRISEEIVGKTRLYGEQKNVGPYQEVFCRMEVTQKTRQDEAGTGMGECDGHIDAVVNAGKDRKKRVNLLRKMASADVPETILRVLPSLSRVASEGTASHNVAEAVLDKGMGSSERWKVIKNRPYIPRNWVGAGFQDACRERCGNKEFILYPELAVSPGMTVHSLKKVHGEGLTLESSLICCGVRDGCKKESILPQEHAASVGMAEDILRGVPDKGTTLTPGLISSEWRTESKKESTLPPEYSVPAGTVVDNLKGMPDKGTACEPGEIPVATVQGV